MMCLFSIFLVFNLVDFFCLVCRQFLPRFPPAAKNPFNLIRPLWLVLIIQTLRFTFTKAMSASFWFCLFLFLINGCCCCCFLLVFLIIKLFKAISLHFKGLWFDFFFARILSQIEMFQTVCVALSTSIIAKNEKFATNDRTKVSLLIYF